MDRKQWHEKFLYPVVRIKAEKSGGSGSIIYSEPDPDNPEEYQTFVITCAHVVDDCIEQKEEWDSLLKKKRTKEFLKQPTVEIFDYVHLSNVNSSNAHRADIVAYDKEYDVAILKLASPKRVEHVATFVPRNKIKDIKVNTPTVTCGCSLLHDPFANEGKVTYLDEIIDNKLYWMNNGNSIFGNSGGAVFLAETGEQIGITARVTVAQLGFNVDVMTWMGFHVSPQGIYEFFDEQELTDTYKKAMERRKKKEKEAKLAMLRASEDGDSSSGEEDEGYDKE